MFLAKARPSVLPVYGVGLVRIHTGELSDAKDFLRKMHRLPEIDIVQEHKGHLRNLVECCRKQGPNDYEWQGLLLMDSISMNELIPSEAKEFDNCMRFAKLLKLHVIVFFDETSSSQDNDYILQYATYEVDFSSKRVEQYLCVHGETYIIDFPDTVYRQLEPEL